MNKKSIVIIVLAVVLLVSVLWFGGLIPKQIGKIYGTKYMNDNFPEMQLEYVDIEWNKYYGDYIIKFKDKEGQDYGCVIGPKYLPISIGQGINVIMETYQEKYTNKENLESGFDVANKIKTIISNGDQISSNPYDYINASKQEYNDLLEHPKETFEYSIKDLIDTNASNGLVSYIEAILCSKINKSFQYDFTSANDYLENYKEFLDKRDSVLNDYDTYVKSLLK
mgnify:CR=1 FL=1